MKLSVEPQLLDNLEVFLAEWSPENAMKFLEGEHDLMRDIPENSDLLDVGHAVLQQLHSRLTAELIGYPRPKDLPANFR